MSSAIIGFWLAEHHGAKLLASSAPEIVAAHIRRADS